ncbi:hypothetical protein [Miniimonas sp. S16]|uniref:hypothetical protein n=1 Tax=Miniimonas sp. S16 TaxID=2171623 RepID=UPI000D529B80|nr:hypothetical protein [Miniimonas sp. S16]
MTTLRLWALLRRRGRTDTHDPAGLTTVLAVVAFAVTTGMALVLLGGFLALLARSEAGAAIGSYDAGLYPILAGFAVLLLLVPLTTLGGAAARLAVSRRDARLAALRLAGATSGQVGTLAVLDAVAQAVVGAVLGVALYAALLPAVAQLRFQGRTFEIAELWVGAGPLALTVLAVVLIAAWSALLGLRRVVITPIGVAARTTPPGLRAMRLLAVVLALIALTVVQAVMKNAVGMLMLVFVVGVVAAGMATLNLVGPFVLGLVGRATAARARSAATLLAGRRLADDPRTAWRSVGGVALATFIAGATSIVALFDTTMASSPGDAIVLQDLKTGGLLTLAIAGVLAGVSTGVMQAGRVIDQRSAYRALALAGADTRVLDAARGRETVIPLVAAVGTATVTMLMFMVPLLGAGMWLQPAVLLQFVGAVAAAVACVLLGAAAARGVAHRMLASGA